MKDPRKIHRDHLIPRPRRILGRFGTYALNARTVHRKIEAAMQLHQSLYCAPDLFLVTHVHKQRGKIGAIHYVPNDDGGAPRGEDARGGMSDASGPAVSEANESSKVPNTHR